MRADMEQLSGPVLAEYAWSDQFQEHANAARNGSDRGTNLPYCNDDETAYIRDRTRHAVEVVQQQLLADNNNAWTMFLGIVDNGTLIGDAAQTALAIEQQNRAHQPGHERNHNTPPPCAGWR